MSTLDVGGTDVNAYRQEVKIHPAVTSTPLHYMPSVAQSLMNLNCFHTVHSTGVSYDWNENISAHSLYDLAFTF